MTTSESVVARKGQLVYRWGMGGYGQFCPIARSTEILCERWTMLVVRELLAGSERFNELQRGVPLMSPSLLSKRLATLESAGIVEREGRRYRLTRAGHDLMPIVEGLAAWGARHIRDEIHTEELDVGLLMWAIRRSLRRDALPGDRSVIEVDFTDAPKSKRRWWLVATEDDVDLCLQDPGHEPDLWVITDVLTLTEVYTRERSLHDALSGGAIRTHGRRALGRSLSDWLQPSPFPLRA